MPKLLVHPDVHTHLAQLDASIRDSIRQKVLWTEAQLAITGRTSRAKGTVAQAWRRTPVRGNQYYIWWAPADEVGASSPDLGPAIAVRDLRHHDELAAPAPAPHTAYDVVHPRELDPRSALQASVASGASLSGTAATIVRGQPGTGKTLSLLYAARDLAASQRILHITYTPQLADDALAFAKAVGFGDKLVVMTLSELVAAILRSPKEATETPRTLAQRFDSMVRSLDSTVVGPWSNKGYALWTEARACLVGMALPFAWQRGPLKVPPCEILDLAIYRDVSGLDDDAAERARHIADIARRRGLLTDQTQARAALETLMRGETGDLPLDDVCPVLLDEAQDLTPVEIALLLELPRAIARRDRAALFIAAGDESQTIHPTGFEWGIAKDLIRERLGREPKDIVLGQTMRNPSAILSIVNKAGSLYKTLPKNFRPSGALAIDAPAMEDIGRVLQCALPQNGAYGPLIETLVMTPGRALITLGSSPPLGKGTHSESAAVTFTPAEIKGLERRIVVVTGLDDTLDTLNRRTTRGVGEHRSLESLEARYLIDGVRVALSRATETLVVLRNESSADGPTRSPIDPASDAEVIEWDELLRLLREDDFSAEERAEGFLAEAHEHERRGDARRALERLDRAEALGRELSDAMLLAIRELRQSLEKKAGLGIVVAEAGGDFTSLQEAIDSVPDGALIQVRPGTYRGPFTMNKDVRIVGDGPRGSVVLEADMVVVEVHSSKVMLDGLSIWRRKPEGESRPKFSADELEQLEQWIAESMGVEPKDEHIDDLDKMAKSGTIGMAVAAEQAQLHMRGCEVIADGARGIVGAVSHVHVEGCIVHHANMGIIAGPNCSMTIERTEVKDCENGIVTVAGARLVVRESSLRNIAQDGFSLAHRSEACIEDNDIIGAHFGIHVGSSIVAMVRRNRIHRCFGGIKLEENGRGIFEENDIAECEDVGFWVGPGGDPTVRGNRIRDGRKYGIYIDAKGGGTFEENQVVGNADTGLTMDGSGMIVVRGSLFRANAKNYYSVYIESGTVGVFEDNEVCHIEPPGCGIYVNAGADFLIRKNRFHHIGRMGIVCRGVGCVIEDNEFFEHKDVAIRVDHGGSPTVRRNRIHHNMIGIAVCDDGEGLYEDNDILMQKDCGVFIQHASAVFRNNRIRKSARFGVLISGRSEPLFEENDISDSGVTFHGGNVGVHKGARPMVRGNMIHGGHIGVVFYGGGQGMAEGNDIALHTQVGVWVKDGSTAIVRGNRIHDTRGLGLVVENAGGTVEGNEVYKNRDVGIRIDSTDVEVSGNRIHDNLGGGLAVQSKSKGLCERNQIIGNKQWGFIVSSDGDPTFRDNLVQGSQFGIVLCKGARGTYIGNDIQGNVQTGFLMEPGSAPSTVEGNISEGAPMVGHAKKQGFSPGLHRSNKGKKGRGK